MVQSLGNSGGCCVGYTQYIALILSHISPLSPAKNIQLKTAGKSQKKQAAQNRYVKRLCTAIEKNLSNFGKNVSSGQKRR